MMSNRSSGSSSDQKFAELTVSPERHAFMREIIEYLQGIHHHIDPDMYDIDPTRLEHFAWCFGENSIDSSGFVMTVTYKDLFDLEIMVDAACTYSNRRTTGSRAGNLTNVGFDALVDWLSQARQALFRSTPAQ